MRTQVTNYIRAGYSGIYIVSREEARIEAEIKAVANALNYGLFAWSITEGLVDTSDGSAHEGQDPEEMLIKALELPENTLLLLRDFHQFLETPNPVLARTLKDVLRTGKTRGLALVVLACRQVLPPELVREFVVVDFSKPLLELVKDMKEGLAEKIVGTEVALNIISGTGKEHMALLSALLKSGLGIRIVANTVEGMREL